MKDVRVICLLTAKLRYPTVFDSNCRNQFSMWSTWNQYWEDIHCFWQVIQEQYPLTPPRYAATLTSGEARCTALVTCFAAGPAALSPSAASASSTSSSPAPPSASLAARHNMAERESLAERYNPCAFCNKEQGSGDCCQLWHLNVFALTWSRDQHSTCCCNSAV